MAKKPDPPAPPKKPRGNTRPKETEMSRESAPAHKAILAHPTRMPPPEHAAGV